MEFVKNIQEIRRNWQPYRVWEIEQQKKDNIDQILRKQNPPSKNDIQKAQQYGKTIVDAIDIMDRNALDKTEDVSLVIHNYSTITMLISLVLGVGLGGLIKKTSLSKKLPDLKPYWELLGIIISTAIASVGVNIWQTNTSKQASRLARFDTRNNELKDYKNFVTYTEEQIKTAKEISENSEEEEIDINFKKIDYNNFQPIKMHKSSLVTKKYLDSKSKDYNKWKTTFIEKEKNKKEYFTKLEKSLTEDDLKQAEKERNAILNAIKKIEKMSNDYSINMKLATFALSGILTVAGTAVGALLAGAISLIQKRCNIPNKYNNKLKLLQFSLITIIPGITSMFAIAPTVKLTKDAARIGRFKAKQELNSNPELFITYSDKEREKISVPDIRMEKNSFWKQLKKDILSLKTLKKDAEEYFNYIETDYIKEQKVRKALNKLEIDSSQEQEAKKLQQQLFYAFEKIDEKQVSFTEDTDAAIDISREVGISIIDFASKLIPIFACAKDIKRINNGNVPRTLKEVLNVMASGRLKTTTIIALSLPFIIPKFLYLYTIFKGIQIKKQANMIGIMSAMNDLNDPKNFIIKKEN